jgi:hypothetical protein
MFVDSGFEEVAFESSEGVFGVGVNRLARPPARFVPGVKMFDFVGYDNWINGEPA